MKLFLIKIKNWLKVIVPFTGVTLKNIEIVIVEEKKAFYKMMNEKHKQYQNK